MKKLIEENVGNTFILIQTIDDDLEIIGEEKGGRATQLTGIEDRILNAYGQTRTAIKEFAQDIGAELAKIPPSARPKQIEIEFNIGVSANYGPIFVFGGSGEAGLKVTMTWELGKDEKPN